MKRRSFLKNLMLSATVVSIGKFLEKSKPNFKFSSTEKGTKLRRNASYFVKPHDKIYFPKSPLPGDYILLKVDQSSVLTSPKIIFQGHPLVGLQEDLTLDSMCIVKFKFINSTTGWTIS